LVGAALSRLIRAGAARGGARVKRKVIPPPCQIGDLNALNRPEEVIRYRLLPAAASCREQPPLEITRTVGAAG